MTKTTIKQDKADFIATLQDLGANVEVKGSVVSAVFRKAPKFQVFDELNVGPVKLIRPSKALLDSFKKRGYSVPKPRGARMLRSRIMPELMTKGGKHRIVIQAFPARADLGVVGIVVQF